MSLSFLFVTFCLACCFVLCVLFSTLIRIYHLYNYFVVQLCSGFLQTMFLFLPIKRHMHFLPIFGSPKRDRSGPSEAPRGHPHPCGPQIVVEAVHSWSAARPFERFFGQRLLDTLQKLASASWSLSCFKGLKPESCDNFTVCPQWSLANPDWVSQHSLRCNDTSATEF